MRIRAVVFDLFGTLVEEFRMREWDRWFAATSEALGVSEEAFREAWRATAIPRQTGKLGDAVGNLRALCERLGVAPEPERLERALAARRELFRRSFRARSDALPTLRAVKGRGYRTALVSMCSPETPPLWRASALAPFVDVEVFSCEVGLRKPDPEIYLLACERLGVEPGACLYVGDGSYHELSGASAVGMRAVLLRDPGEREGEFFRPAVEDWAGPAIATLPEVLELLDRA